MPEIEIDGARIWYAVEGRDSAPAVLLLHSLGTSHALWDEQMPSLRKSFRVIRSDMRGHGNSSASSGEFTIEQLGRDALAVLDAAGAPSAAVCGISLGGVTGIWIAQHASRHVKRLVLANTGARIGTSEGWSARIRTVREQGMQKTARDTMERWFTAGFRESRPEVIARFQAIASACPLESYVAACAALRDADLRKDLHRVVAPTLVIAGSEDLSTTVADGKYLRDNIPDAELEVLEAAHLSNVERSEEFSELLTVFLKS
ncbi:MAG TPA: 3-oxoadipate enol-lactonase [Gemmatimonadaceae bacterium]|nr:3-oxoadipate enol-lactonase [Gemmatimonadaceae bacterium]